MQKSNFRIYLILKRNGKEIRKDHQVITKADISYSWMKLAGDGLRQHNCIE